MYMCTFFSTCSNGSFACGKESCEEQIVCPKNQVYRKGVTACRKTCELYGREMICDSDVLMDGCVCDESNNQTAYMAPDVRYNSPNTPQNPPKTPRQPKKKPKNETKQNKNNTKTTPKKKKNNKKENYKRYSRRPKKWGQIHKTPIHSPIPKKLKEMEKIKNQNFITLLHYLWKIENSPEICHHAAVVHGQTILLFLSIGYLCIVWTMPLSVRNHVVQTRRDRDLRLQSFVSVLWVIYFYIFWIK